MNVLRHNYLLEVYCTQVNTIIRKTIKGYLCKGSVEVVHSTYSKKGTILVHQIIGGKGTA